MGLNMNRSSFSIDPFVFRLDENYFGFVLYAPRLRLIYK